MCLGEVFLKNVDNFRYFNFVLAEFGHNKMRKSFILSFEYFFDAFAFLFVRFVLDLSETG